MSLAETRSFFPVANYNAGDQHFSYDDLDRLTLANGPYGASGANATLPYSYDEIGNMTVNPEVGAYSYPASGPGSTGPHAVSVAGPYPLTYDNNGNVTTMTDPSGYYGYAASSDAENHLTSVTTTYGGVPSTVTFVYDGDGGRVKKIEGTTTTRYLSKLYECDITGRTTSCTRFIWAGSTRVATVASNGAVHYWHGDHLGSSSVITDSTGATVQAITYLPYGDLLTNQSVTTPAVDVPYKYTGKELDTSSNLYFYESRYYHPVFGRFVSPDTIVPNPRDPQSLNRYSYAGNNPLKYSDPTGHFKFGKFFSRAFHPVDTFLKHNAWARALGWAFAPGMMMNVDPQTRTQVWAAGAGIATGGLVGGPWGAILGGASGGATSAALQDGNIVRGTLAGAAAGAIGYGMAPICTVLCSGPAAGAASAAIRGEDPGKAALYGLAVAVAYTSVRVYSNLDTIMATARANGMLPFGERVEVFSPSSGTTTVSVPFQGGITPDTTSLGPPGEFSVNATILRSQIQFTIGGGVSVSDVTPGNLSFGLQFGVVTPGPQPMELSYGPFSIYLNPGSYAFRGLGGTAGFDLLEIPQISTPR